MGGYGTAFLTTNENCARGCARTSAPVGARACVRSLRVHVPACARWVCACAPVLETRLSALEREAFFDLCAKYRPCIRLMYDASDEEKARVELLESLLNAAPVDDEGVEEEKGA